MSISPGMFIYMALAQYAILKVYKMKPWTEKGLTKSRATGCILEKKQHASSAWLYISYVVKPEGNCFISWIKMFYIVLLSTSLFGTHYVFAFL